MFDNALNGGLGADHVQKDVAVDDEIALGADMMGRLDDVCSSRCDLMP